MQHDYQKWLEHKFSADPQVVIAGKIEYLRVYLTSAMREVRNKRQVTQEELAAKMGVQQPAISKLESPERDREVESILTYLHQLNSDLMVAVKLDNEILQVSENDGFVLVDVPQEIQQKALLANMTLREYVLAAIEQYEA